MNLKEIRDEINKIDEEMVRLFCRRMDCAAKVADYKAANAMPVLDEGREREVIRRAREQAGGYGDGAESLFASLMEVSRALQHGRLDAGSALRGMIDSASDHPVPASNGRVCCQGVPGAFSDEAASVLFPGIQPCFVDRFEDVCLAVGEGRADYGILPVENATSGSVHEVYDLLIRHKFTIAAAAKVRVDHCLLAHPDAEESALKTVLSHPQALSQCADTIAARGLVPVPYGNTAAAAEEIAKRADRSSAAIASSRAAVLYGLRVIERGIQSKRDNYTRFVAISRTLTVPENADKISLLFSLPHVTGSLYRVLARFAAVGLNLSKLESRPTDSADYSYTFYVDFEGSLRDPSTLNLLCALSDELPGFAFLGSYREKADKLG